MVSDPWLQGMRCPDNTHKPSFHVNTSTISKHSAGKGTGSGQKGACATPMEEMMTKEEFFECLQSAMRAGIFDTFAGSASANSPVGKGGNSSKSGGGGGSGTSGVGGTKRKKGRKQW